MKELGTGSEWSSILKLNIFKTSTMSTFTIEGGRKLSGSIVPQGAKNEALQVISAVLLTEEEVTLSNVPEILDVKNLISMLEDMGVKVTRKSKGEYTFRPTAWTGHMWKALNSFARVRL